MLTHDGVRISVGVLNGAPVLVLRSEHDRQVIAFNTREEAREIGARLVRAAADDE